MGLRKEGIFVWKLELGTKKGRDFGDSEVGCTAGQEIAE
jgi:hypothetical protein